MEAKLWLLFDINALCWYYYCTQVGEELVPFTTTAMDQTLLHKLH